MMKKKNKIILMLILIIGIILSSFEKVNAHSVELDPDNLISFPMMIWSGQGKFIIKNSETGYSLYYQAVEISNTIYGQMQQIRKKGEEELKVIDTQRETLGEERNKLEVIYSNARNAYQEKITNGITGTELESAKQAYETAFTNYKNKATEYADKVKEYSKKETEIEEKVKELTPTYVEGKWIKTEDDSLKIDLSQFSGEKVFVIWAKLVRSNGTINYDEGIYTMSGNKTENVEPQGISLDKTTVELTVGDSEALVATITPSNATNKSVVWKSDKEDVATVSDGKVTAKSVGTATITASTSDGKYKATCKVTVSNKKDIPKNNTSSDKDKTTATNTSTTSTDANTKTDVKDTTVAKVILPKTGTTVAIVSVIFSMLVIAIVCYKRYHNYRDIK